MCLAFSTTVNDAHCSTLPALRCTVRRLVPVHFPRGLFPSRHPSRWTPSPGKPPPSPPRGRSLQDPAPRQHTGNNRRRRSPHPPELSRSPGSPRASPVPPAAPRSPHAGSLSAWQKPPPTPGPLSTPHGRPSLLSQSRQTDKPPTPTPRGCLGTRPQGGHRSSYSMVKTRDRLRAKATRPAPSSLAQPGLTRPQANQAIWPCPDFPPSPRAR